MRLSERYPWFAPQNRLTEAYGKRLAAWLPLVDLSVSNPTTVALNLPIDLDLAYEPEAAGRPEVRAAIAAYYAGSFGVDVSPQRVQLTASTSEAYSFCLKLVADPGGEILIPEPSYPLLEYLVRAEGLTPVSYRSHYAGGEWILDRQALAASINGQTRAIVLVQPNNPTGHFWTEDNLRWLREETPEDLWWISDEVFADYCWVQPQPRLRTLAAFATRRAFCLSGLSKVCALPQMKLGWIVMPDDAAVWKAMEFLADTYLSVSSPVQAAAPAWLAARESFQLPIRERCGANLARLAATGGLELLQPESGWVAVVRVPGVEDEEAVCLKLLERGYWVQPGFYYDLPVKGAFVVSLLTKPTDLVKGLAALTSCGK